MNKKEFEALCNLRGKETREIKSAWRLLEFLRERKRVGCINKISIAGITKCTKLQYRTIISAGKLLLDLNIINDNWELVE